MSHTKAKPHAGQLGMRLKPPLKNSTVLITGASAGIGWALAEQLAPHVRTLVLVARREERLKELQAKLKSLNPDLNCAIYAVDLADRESLERFLFQVDQEIGEIHNLINNAGSGDVGLFEQSDWKKIEKMLDLNIYALTRITHHFVRPMIRRKRGGILNVSSGFGLVFMPGFSAYVGSKHYVSALSESLRSELRSAGIAVTQVCPGPVATEFYESATGSKEGFAPDWVSISADRCAREAIRGFRKGKALVIPGLAAKLLIAAGRLSPRAVLRTVWNPLGSEMRRNPGRFLPHSQTRRSITKLALIVSAISASASPPSAHAWGPIGHRMVAETAARLITDRKEEQQNLPRFLHSPWGDFLTRHRYQLGRYSVLPDSIFKFQNGRLEKPTHFLDMNDAYGIAEPSENPLFLERVKKTPEKYSKAVKYLKELNPKFDPSKHGMVPWRVQQLSDLATKSLKGIKLVKGRYQQGNSAMGTERRIFNGLYYLGLLSHYTGDVGVPYHSSANYDGWQTEQGGIHLYFENDCIDELEPGISEPVIELARKNAAQWTEQWKQMVLPEAQKKQDEPSASQMVLALLTDSTQSLPEANKLDLEHAVIEKSDSKKKKRATRKPPREACPKLRDFIVERLARASVLTAWVWSKSLPEETKFDSNDVLQFAGTKRNPAYLKPEFR